VEDSAKRKSLVSKIPIHIDWENFLQLKVKRLISMAVILIRMQMTCFRRIVEYESEYRIEMRYRKIEKQSNLFWLRSTSNVY